MSGIYNQLTLRPLRLGEGLTRGLVTSLGSTRTHLTKAASHTAKPIQERIDSSSGTLLCCTATSELEQLRAHHTRNNRV